MRILKLTNKHQFLFTKLQGNVSQLKRRIKNQILGVKRLNHSISEIFFVKKIGSVSWSVSSLWLIVSVTLN